MDSLRKEVPISLLYGSRSWVDRDPGFQIKCTRQDSYVDVVVSLVLWEEGRERLDFAIYDVELKLNVKGKMRDFDILCIFVYLWYWRICSTSHLGQCACVSVSPL